uniref:Uncharacterized protein n=1 Tax=Panagrolaimus sp. JU765 TaxID=591449 RepID=A0AC34PY83_9BILA
MVNEDVDTDYGRKYSCDHAKTELETILKAIKPDLLIIDQWNSQNYFSEIIPGTDLSTDNMTKIISKTYSDYSNYV